MTYNEQLPDTEALVRLSRHIGPYPITRKEMVRTARYWDINGPVVKFLKLFPSDEVFENQTDFITRSEELAMMIAQEQASPKETLHSPQD